MRKEDKTDIDRIQNYYDTVYYRGAREGDAPTRHHHQLAARLNIESGTRVLDVACGTGTWLRACTSRGADVAGVDLSAKAIQICRALIPKGRFEVSAAEKLPFADASFDLVSCLGALEHFVRPELALQEICRVALPEARVLILVPNHDFLTRRLGWYGGTDQVQAKETVLTIEQWHVLFDGCGLEVVDKWKDLHILSWSWLRDRHVVRRPLLLLQGLLLALWPLRWQYQIYFLCRLKGADPGRVQIRESAP